MLHHGLKHVTQLVHLDLVKRGSLWNNWLEMGVLNHVNFGHGCDNWGRFWGNTSAIRNGDVHVVTCGVSKLAAKPLVVGGFV